jgi:hypothetical protein
VFLISCHEDIDHNDDDDNGWSIVCDGLVLIVMGGWCYVITFRNIMHPRPPCVTVRIRQSFLLVPMGRYLRSYDTSDP